jgi:hypothetical protein
MSTMCLAAKLTVRWRSDRAEASHTVGSGGPAPKGWGVRSKVGSSGCVGAAGSFFIEPTPHDGRTSVPVLDAACKVKLGSPYWAICPSWCSQWCAMRQMQDLPIGTVNLVTAD